MDELSFYATIVCIVLIKAVFLWLYHDDYYSRKLAPSQVKQRGLAVFVVLFERSDPSFYSRLQDKLESLNFAVHKIKLITTDAGSASSSKCKYDNDADEHHESDKLVAKPTDNLIELHDASSSITTVDGVSSAAKLIENQLKPRSLRLHALILLAAPETGDRKPRPASGDQDQSVAQIREVLSACGLIAALENVLAEHKTRIVSFDRDHYSIESSDDHDAVDIGRGPTRGLFAEFLSHKCLNQYLEVQDFLAGESWVKIELITGRKQPKVGQWAELFARLFGARSLDSSCADQLSELLVDKHSSEKPDSLRKKMLDALTRSVLLEHPSDQRVELFYTPPSDAII